MGIVAAAIVLAVAALAAATSETVEEGAILPYTSADAKRLEIFGSFTVVVQNEPPSTGDSLTAGVFFALAGSALLTALALASTGGRGRRLWFWGMLAVGAAGLGLDELVGIHEAIGANLRFLEDLAPVNSPEDVVILLYAVPVLAFLYLFRDLLTASRRGARLIGGGFALYVVAAMLDALDALLDEQIVELASVTALFCGFLLIAQNDLSTRAKPTAG